ncbi:hypothetical protein TNCV_4583111 [Trichonephila clavipes]|nr:hypothetical protein TNCV_4583111 [Trichonephila clavipes]
MRTETVETFELVKVEPKLLREEKGERERRDIHPICCKIDGKLPILLFVKKVNSFESLCDLIISDKLFETLNKETATHIDIREAEDWFRPIDLAKECDIYISSKNGSRKETPITYGYTKTPLKIDHKTLKPKIKENYPQYLEREIKIAICGDSSHCARDCEKRFKPKESNDHIHNRINVNTLKIEAKNKIAMNSKISICKHFLWKISP